MKSSTSLAENIVKLPERAAPAHIPGATYRLQFSANFTLCDATALLDYLRDLGITDVCASPLLQAGPASTHGYDTCCYGKISECLGGETAFAEFTERLRELGMGLLLDIVPNHMGADETNAWWWDVLKHGPASRYAGYFDIDWERGGGKVVLPVLEAALEEVLAAGKLSLATVRGEPVLRYYERCFPLCASPTVPDMEHRLGREILESQRYRLIHWRNGAHEINYRRFFDVSDLVGLRVELPEVFESAHEFVFQLLRDGRATGLRVDHPDGLRDPREYFERLQSSLAQITRAGRPLYIVAEKILSRSESLPADWPVAGTTGYDFLNEVNALFVSGANEAAMDALYREFTGCTQPFEEVARRAKRRVLEKSFPAEVNALAERLEQIATAAGEDFANSELRGAITESIACFPVYRNYVGERSRELEPADDAVLARAIASAKAKAPTLVAPLEFLRAVLSLRMETPGAREFVSRFQQLTGPAAAKGIEDTAFYRYNRLVSLNEVGGDPAQFGISVEAFHQCNLRRAEQWPHSLLATSTHDTKRGEDVRARINVLSEMPVAWQSAVLRWREWNAGKKTILRGVAAPDANDEYLLYQTLIGAWPCSSSGFGLSSAQLAPELELHGAPLQKFRERVAAYMLKAIREAKRHTSWTETNEDYERAMQSFVERLLNERSNCEFLQDFAAFQRKVAFFGAFNALAQTLLKITSPGVPDFYQGSELWDLNLVDPDNRRPVDYATARQRLNERARPERGHPVREFTWDHMGALKLFVIQRALQFRNAHRELMDFGGYASLGTSSEHVCAFARIHKEESCLVIVPRLLCMLLKGVERGPTEEVWHDETVSIHSSSNDVRTHPWRNIFTTEVVQARDRTLGMNEVFATFPLALLTPEI